MKISRSLRGAVLAVALSSTLFAQTPQTGYHTVGCFKVRPNKAAELRKFLGEEAHKLAQGRVDDGELTTWYLLRAVVPQGREAECDYIAVAFFPGTPNVLGTQELSAAIKRSGISITPEDYINQRDAVATLVSFSVFQNVASAGSPKKGDYFRVEYMKTANRDDFVAYEKRVWQPVNETLIKDGIETGWSVNTRVLPGGADQPFQAVVTVVFPSMDAVFSYYSKIGNEFRKAHPDMEVGTTLEQFDKFMEQFEKVRTIQNIQLYQLEDMATK